MPVAAAVARKPAPAGPVQRRAEPTPRLTRKCAACGGGGLFDNLALQTKLSVSEPGDADEREADRVADHVVARLAGQGGGDPAIQERPAAGAQRQCASCANEHAQRKAAAGPRTENRVQLEASGGERLAPAQQRRMEGAFGRDFAAVRVHDDAAANQSARRLAARAYTVGGHVYFADGEYQPGTTEGDRLLAHELTHVVQQARAGPSAPQRKCAACEAEEAVAGPPVQRDVFDGVPTLPSWDDIEQAGSELIDEAVGAGKGVVNDVRETAEGVIDAGVSAVNYVVEQALALANQFAAALGGASVELDGTAIVITAPGPVPVCPNFDFALELPGMGAEFPLFFGAVEIAGPVLAYGEVGASATLTPSVLGRLGPCAVSGVRLVIDPVAGSFSGSGALTATTALGLAAALDLALFGEVGLLIVWPDPPFALTIPVVTLQAGLEGLVHGMVGTQINVAGAMSYGGGVFSLAASERQTLGFAADAGIAGFGELDFLGQNLCRLYWPLVDWHDDVAFDSGFDLALALGPGFAVATLATLPTTLNPLGWAALGILIPRELFTDDCPLCGILQRAGLMPSMLGGEWKPGSPGTPHPGPVLVYPNAPPIASGSRCRGACGPDCKTCHPGDDPTTHERKACEESTDQAGRVSHHFWIYPNFHECNTHEGCRQHDACYDWSAGYGERGPFGILGPIHRLCDLEAMCNYGAKQAVGWIFGKPPYDGGMDFSDEPKLTGDCPGPCPDERVTDETARQRICLPELILFDQHTPLSELLNESTDWIKLFEIPVDIPYLPPVLLGLFARGEMDADVSARIGPLVLRNVCLDIDPVNADHRGTAELNLWSDIEGGLALTGQVEGRAGWGCLLGVIDATVLSGLLGLTASARAKLSAQLIDTVDVSCQDGKIVLDNDLTLKPCLDLLFALDAALKLEIFHRFEIFHRRWHLADWKWNKCWPIELMAFSTPLGDWDFDLAAQLIDMVDLLRDLLGDGNSDTPGVGATATLPRDPARAAGETNPCGSDVRPDDQCGSKALPYTRLSYSPGSRGQGIVATAEPLSKCTETPGSKAKESVYREQFDCMRGIPAPPGAKAKYESQFWVRAHLVHGDTGKSAGNDLHGPGDKSENLIIADNSFNQGMRNGPEGEAIRRVHSLNEVLWYETRVTPFDPPEDLYGKSVVVRIGTWDTESNTRGPQIPGSPFGQYTTKRAVPPCH